jgi:hypothetical protein
MSMLKARQRRGKEPHGSKTTALGDRVARQEAKRDHGFVGVEGGVWMEEPSADEEAVVILLRTAVANTLVVLTAKSGNRRI